MQPRTDYFDDFLREDFFAPFFAVLRRAVFFAPDFFADDFLRADPFLAL